ncbi:MAG: hypothetical protein V1742_03325, partial [Pseudomonadota bacterium]
MVTGMFKKMKLFTKLSSGFAVIPVVLAAARFSQVRIGMVVDLFSEVDNRKPGDMEDATASGTRLHNYH